MIGRVSSLDWVLSLGLAPLSYALTGPIADELGARPTLLGCGGLGGIVLVHPPGDDAQGGERPVHAREGLELQAFDVAAAFEHKMKAFDGPPLPIPAEAFLGGFAIGQGHRRQQEPAEGGLVWGRRFFLRQEARSPARA